VGFSKDSLRFHRRPRAKEYPLGLQPLTTLRQKNVANVATCFCFSSEKLSSEPTSLWGCICMSRLRTVIPVVRLLPESPRGCISLHDYVLIVQPDISSTPPIVPYPNEWKECRTILFRNRANCSIMIGQSPDQPQVRRMQKPALLTSVHRRALELWGSGVGAVRISLLALKVVNIAWSRLRKLGRYAGIDTGY